MLWKPRRCVAGEERLVRCPGGVVPGTAIEGLLLVIRLLVHVTFSLGDAVLPHLLEEDQN